MLPPNKIGLEVTVKLLKPMVVEEFKRFGHLGRVIFRDHNRTLAAGVVVHVARRLMPGSACNVPNSAESDFHTDHIPTLAWTMTFTSA